MRDDSALACAAAQGSWTRCEILCQQIASNGGRGESEGSDVQGSKALVVGDARAFLSMYQVLAAAGLRAVQLERMLQRASLDATSISEVPPCADPRCPLTHVKDAAV